MKKQTFLVFKCSVCGHEEPKWLGRCPECGEWNSLIETSLPGRGMDQHSPRNHPKGPLPQSIPLSAVDAQEGSRISSGIPELDRVLGGGIMKRSAILVGGEPGIGKSTLLLQIAAAAGTKGRILYVSGEESAGQVRIRGDRLGITTDRIELCCTGNLAALNAVLEAVKPMLLMVDSVQTLYTDEAGMAPGTVNQLKYCSSELITWVKEHDAALFLAAHVTKEGLISGPKTLEHLVDTVLYFEQSHGDRRFLRVTKNRFGSVDEIGIFIMEEQGLKVADPGLLFLVRREGKQAPGIATAAVLEGTRVLLVEIQALTVPAKSSAMSRVLSDRIDHHRVSRVAATLEKHLGLRLSDQDIYINVAGGIRITEVGVELPLACALYSARTGHPVPGRIAIAGELSLAGEVRPVRGLTRRIKTIQSLGFDQFLGPHLDPLEESSGSPHQTSEATIPGTTVLAVKDIQSAIKSLF
jgi:DNA repair protein RadA/Sms